MSTNRTSKRLSEHDESSAPGQTIMFLRAHSKGLESTERFLHSRGWKVQIVTGSIQKGLQVAAAFKPDYLFISSEIIPKDFTELCNALKKTFHVILFAERPDAHALRLLQQLGAPHVVLTPLTGPTVERMIFKINSSAKSIGRRLAQGAHRTTASRYKPISTESQARPNRSSRKSAVREPGTRRNAISKNHKPCTASR